MALFDSVPACVVLTVKVRAAVAPLASEPTAHVTVPPLFVQPVEADTNVTDAGRVSAMDTGGVERGEDIYARRRDVRLEDSARVGIRASRAEGGHDVAVAVGFVGHGAGDGSGVRCPAVGNPGLERHAVVVGDVQTRARGTTANGHQYGDC